MRLSAARLKHEYSCTLDFALMIHLDHSFTVIVIVYHRTMRLSDSLSLAFLLSTREQFHLTSYQMVPSF